MAAPTVFKRVQLSDGTESRLGFDHEPSMDEISQGVQILESRKSSLIQNATPFIGDSAHPYVDKPGPGVNPFAGATASATASSSQLSPDQINRAVQGSGHTELQPAQSAHDVSQGAIGTLRNAGVIDRKTAAFARIGNPDGSFMDRVGGLWDLLTSDPNETLDTTNKAIQHTVLANPVETAAKGFTGNNPAMMKLLHGDQYGPDPLEAVNFLNPLGVVGLMQQLTQESVPQGKTKAKPNAGMVGSVVSTLLQDPDAPQKIANGDAATIKKLSTTLYGLMGAAAAGSLGEHGGIAEPKSFSTADGLRDMLQPESKASTGVRVTPEELLQQDAKIKGNPKIPVNPHPSITEQWASESNAKPDVAAPAVTPSVQPEATKGVLPVSGTTEPVAQTIRVFHGTKSEFNDFDITRAGSSDPGVVGKGLYFAPSEAQATNFAESPHYGGQGTPRVVAADVTLKNPYIIQDGILPDGRHLSDVHPQGIREDSAAKIKAQIQRKGFDGVIFKTGDDVTQVVAYDPGSVKVVPKATEAPSAAKGLPASQPSAEAPAATPPEGSGLSRSSRAAMADVLGTEKPTSIGGKSHAELLSDGQKALDAGFDADGTIKKLAKNGHPASDEQIGIFAAHRDGLIAELKKLNGKLDGEMAPDERAAAVAAKNDLLDHIKTFDQHLDEVKGANGRALSALKIGHTVNWADMGEVEVEARRIKPTLTELPKPIKDSVAEVAARDARIAALEKENETLKSTSTAETTKRAPRKTYTKDDAQLEIQRILDEHKKAYIESQGALHANPIGGAVKLTAATLKAAGDIAHVYMKLGASSLEEVIGKTLAHFDHLPPDERPTRQNIVDELGKTGKKSTRSELDQQIASLKSQARNESTAGKAKIEAAIADLKNQIQTGEYRVPTKRELVVSEELKQLRTERDMYASKVRAAINDMHKGLADKILHIQREAVISSPNVFEKIPGAGILNMANNVITEPIGRMAGQIRIKGTKLADIAGREGQAVLPQTLARLRAVYPTKQAIVNAWNIVKHGITPTDAALGNANRLGPVTRAHAALTTIVTETPEMNAAGLARTESAIRRGLDPADPKVAEGIRYASALDAQNEAMRGPNGLAKWISNNLRAGTKSESVGVRATAIIAKTQAPIVKMPLNILKRTLENAGLAIPEAVGRTIHAVWSDAPLTEPQADALIRSYKRAGTAGMVISLSLMFPDQVKDALDKLGVAGHGSVADAFRLWIKAGEAFRGGDGLKDQIVKAGKAVGGEVAYQTPGLGNLESDLGALKGQRSGERWAADQTMSFYPGALKWLAGFLDKQPTETGIWNYLRAEPIKRSPQDFADTVKANIPGLRQSVPEKN